MVKRYKRKKLHEIKKICQERVLELHYNARSGHIGSSLSCLDILLYLYFSKMDKDDKCILSKGHAATALYAVLAQIGIISERDLKTFHQDGTYLAAHPPCSGSVAGITFGTGSLGHGLSLATGLALASKLEKKYFDVYCVVSEGDCNEGSTWEAAMFASQHKLKNLTVIIDNNQLQAFGRSKDVLNLEPLTAKWKSFGFDVVKVKNGNDFKQLEEAFKLLEARNSNKPKCIIAKTTKGSGISFMENKLEWHYLPMNDDQFKEALRQIRGSNA